MVAAVVAEWALSRDQTARTDPARKTMVVGTFSSVVLDREISLLEDVVNLRLSEPV